MSVFLIYSQIYRASEGSFKRTRTVSGSLQEYAYKRCRFVIPRDSLRYQLLSLTTKAKNLTKILTHYFPVPPGFAVAVFASNLTSLDGFR